MKKLSRKLMTLAISLMVAVAFAISAGAEEVPAVPITTTIQPVIDSMLSIFSVANLMLILGAAVAGGMGFVLGWFGVRKISSVIQTAFKKGKFKI